MLIAQISDTHISMDLPEGAARLADLRRTVAAINALEQQPDAVIHTGDLANRGKDEEYAAAKSVLEGLRAPFYPVPGNRDRREGLRESFIRWSCLDDDEPFVQYAVDDLPVRLLGLDSQSGTSQKGDFCESRAAALAGALAAQPQRPTVVFLHHPPFEVEGDPRSFQYVSREGMARVATTLRSAGRVVRVLCGHAHQAREVVVGGVLASTVPSLAVDLREGDDPRQPSGAPRFQLHRYHPSRGFTTEGVEAA
jgi:3',5'-cyclic AMP phosphodiesterase CpdA